MTHVHGQYGPIQRDDKFAGQTLDRGDGYVYKFQSRCAAFIVVPRIGTKVEMRRGQVFTLIGVQSYTRQNGQPSFVLHWEAVDDASGESVFCTSGLVGSPSTPKSVNPFDGEPN